MERESDFSEKLPLHGPALPLHGPLKLLVVSRRASVVAVAVSTALAVELAWTSRGSAVLLALAVVVAASAAAEASPAAFTVPASVVCSHLFLFNVQLVSVEHDVVLKIGTEDMEENG